MNIVLQAIDLSNICYPCELIKKEHERRKSIALNATLNSPLVLDAIEELAISTILDHTVPLAEVMRGYASALDSALRGVQEYKEGDKLMGSVRLINTLASLLQDEIAKTLRFPLPLSALTNLAGTVIGVYLTEYALA